MLVVDTCLAACQVGVFEGDRLVVGSSEAMERGHQERLAPMAAEVMAEAGLDFSSLSKIAVTVGPGSFTGLRVGLAFVKGLHLATGAPLAGLGTLAALAASAGADGGRNAGVIDARRGMVYLQAFARDQPLSAAEALPAADVADRLAAIAAGPWRVAGPGAALLGAADNVERLELAAPQLRVLGQLAARAQAADDVRPIYLRAPDAKPIER
jgi:tRNA threonylcarbamoyladenosine biosynthesis protein TsaB